jgi:hypothetical protein
MKLFKCFLFSMLLLAGAAAKAQDNSSVNWGKNEVHAGIGIFSVPEIGNAIGSALPTIAGATIDKSSGTGAICFGYRYHLNKKWAFGISGVAENINVTYKKPDEYYAFSTYTAMADVHYYYVHQQRFQLYSGVYAGLADYRSNSGPGVHSDQLALHLTALGFRFGKTIGVFGEAGFGYRGVFNAGISARF